MTETGKKKTIWTHNFICIMLANCLLQMSHSSTNALVSTYASFLGAGPKLMGLLTGMFFAVALAMRPVAGPVQTRSNQRTLMLGVFVIGCVVNVGYALFHSIPAFLLFRILHGVQYAFVGSLCMVIASSSLPQERLASGLGVFGVSSAISQAIAPHIGLGLRAWGTARGGEDFGYTAMFVFAALMMAAALIPTSLLRTERPTLKTQAAAPAGKWYRNILSRHTLAPAAVLMLLIMAYSIYNGYMVPFAEEIGVANIGVFFTVLAAVMLAARPVSGALTDKLGSRVMLIPSAALFLISFLMVGNASALPFILAGAAVAATGYGAANPVMQAMAMQTEPPERRAVASNTLYVGMDIGYFIGPLLGGFVRDFAGNYRTVILFGAVPAALAAVIFLVFWPQCSRRIEAVKAMTK